MSAFIEVTSGVGDTIAVNPESIAYFAAVKNGCIVTFKHGERLHVLLPFVVLQQRIDAALLAEEIVEVGKPDDDDDDGGGEEDDGSGGGRLGMH